MPGERAIHFTIFALLLIGLCAVSAWICYAYVQPLILQIAGIAMSWGVILLILYAGFLELGWQWWNQ